MAKSEATSVASLSRSPSHLLHRALQLALDVYGDATGPGAVTQRQFAVLAAVAENEGLTQTKLVRSTGIDRSTLADLVARMIEKGYLARERSKADARAKTVRLTDKGRAALVEATPRVAEADARILSHLAASRRDGFLNALEALAKAGEANLLGIEAEAPAAKKAKAEKSAKTKAEKSHKDKKPHKDKKKVKKAKKGEREAVEA